MKSLGFRNFRKFLNQEQLDLGRVNVLVGENNSGKSTFTKATLLLAKFLRNNSGRFDQIPNNQYNSEENGRIPYNRKEFSFSSLEFRNVYIDTFYQALSSDADSGVIRFYSSIGDFEIELSVAEPLAFRDTEYYNEYVKEHCDDEFDVEQWTSEVYPIIREEDPELYRKELSLDKASITYVRIIDKKRCLDFILNYEKSRIQIGQLNANDLKQFEETQLRISEVEKFSREYYILLHELDDITKNLHSVYSVVDKHFTVLPGKDNKLGWLMSSIESERKKANDDISRQELLEMADAACKEMYRMFDEFTVEYIYAHSVHQLSSYRHDRNDNDYVDQTISLYYDKLVCAENSSLDDVGNPDRFVEKWMLSFGIGEQFEIKKDESQGNRLTVYIYDDGVRQDLSSKGIGAIQMFLLLLRTALIIFDGNSKLKVIAVEEPEQNLHPALQSKLADFFYEVSQMCGCQFLIETHSEYMVRRMQVMVSERDMRGSDNGNPFKVFYFPADGEPYDMCFLPNGLFKNHFGSGFFDISGALNVELLMNAKNR